MIIWSGAGILIPLVFIACIFLGVKIFPDDDGTDRFWAFVGLTTAIFSWVAGMVLNTKRGKIVIDEETGEEILLIKGGGHALLWIPMQYWGIIWAVLTIIVIVCSKCVDGDYNERDIFCNNYVLRDEIF